MEIFENMGTALKPKRNLTPTFTEDFLDKLPEVKRINQPTCGEIAAIKGYVMIYRNGRDEGVQAFPGMALKRGDTVRALGNSLALIELDDRSTLYLNKDTDIQLSSGIYSLSLSFGELFAMMKPQKRTFEIRTPSAALSILGTDFDAKVTKNKTILKVLKGKVSFKNESGDVIVKRKRQVEASKYTTPTLAKMRDTKSITKWTFPIKPEKKKGGLVMKKFVWLMLGLTLMVGGILYLTKEKSPEKTPTIPERDAGKKETMHSGLVKSKAEEEVLAVLQDIQKNMREKNYEQLRRYGGVFSHRNPAMLKEYLEKELNDNIIGTADYIFKGEPTKFIPSGDAVTLVLKEPWQGTTCNLVFVKRRGRWTISDINNIYGLGQYIQSPTDEPVPQTHNTIGMSAEEVIRAFYQAMIAKDADKAVGYLALPDDKTALQGRNVFRMLFKECSITEIREIRVSGKSALVRFGVEDPFPGFGVAVRPYERQGKLALKDTETGLKIDFYSGILGDRPEDYR